MSKVIATHPVQTIGHKGGGRCPELVTMAAYEVYCYVYSPQEAMITGDCQGGFGAGELIAFLYARSFPKDQWKARVHEAFTGMEHV